MLVERSLLSQFCKQEDPSMLLGCTKPECGQLNVDILHFRFQQQSHYITRLLVTTSSLKIIEHARHHRYQQITKLLTCYLFVCSGSEVPFIPHCSDDDTRNVYFIRHQHKHLQATTASRLATPLLKTLSWQWTSCIHSGTESALNIH